MSKQRQKVEQQVVVQQIGSIVEIPIEMVLPNPEQPRHDFDPENWARSQNQSAKTASFSQSLLNNPPATHSSFTTANAGCVHRN